MSIKPFLVAVFCLCIAGTCLGQDADNEPDAKQGSSVPVKKNSHVLAFSPMQFTENGVGFSFSYEKAIDKEGVVAFNIPIISTFNLSRSYYEEARNKQDPMFYCSPGLKFYPTGTYGKTRYAIGPALVVGAGEISDSYYYNYKSDQVRTFSKFMLGIMVANSLNINPSEHIYLGLDLGLGFTYINMWDGVSQGIEPIVQGGFKIGYRF